MQVTHLYRATLSLSLMLFGLWIGTLDAVAGKYRPPGNMERPKHRQGAATRNPCDNSAGAFLPLVPQSNYGQTLQAYPTFYWLNAGNRYQWAEFELYQTQNQERVAFPLYRTVFRIQNDRPISRLTLPSESGLPPLAVGQEYLWKVTLICSAGGPDDEFADGSQQAIQGWVSRVSPPANLQLPANPGVGSTYGDLADNGLWYDALDDLYLAHQGQPQNPQLQADWAELMQATALPPEQLALLGF